MTTGSLLRRRSVRPVQTFQPQTPTVSVVIPCHNYERYLPAAIDSAISQAGVEVDVIVVDDASTDGSLDAARAAAKRHANVQVVAHSENTGPVITFNDGLDLARGEFLVRLDADDLLTPGALLRAVEVMRAHPSVGLVYGHPLHFEGDRLPRARERATAWTLWPGREWLADRCRTGVNVITSPEVVMRSSVVARVGGQRPLAHTHDMEMWLRISAVSDVAYIRGADQAWHREHNASLSARKVDAYVDMVERKLAFETLFDWMTKQRMDTAGLREDAMRAVAASALRQAIRLYDHGAAESETRRYIDVAATMVADLERVPGWAGLQRRKAVGAARARRSPLSKVARLYRRVLSDFEKRRWHRQGIF